MDLSKYIEKYGNKTFEELDFNEVDNLIFSYLAYINFRNIVSKDENNKITLLEASNNFFDRYSEKELKMNIIAVRSAIGLLKKIRNQKRYKDILLYNYAYKSSDTLQFSAMCIDYIENYTYITFEGTDDLISGWLEDFMTSYKFPVEAQKLAIRYVNNNINFLSDRKYIIGGHSKGGNLALVSAMYASPFISNRIVKVYSNDGQGLRDEQINTRRYKNILKKYELIVPEYSIVGMLLRHTGEYTVVSSSKKGPICHDGVYWEIDGTSFKKTSLSDFSKKLDETITNWLDKHTTEEIEELCNDVFEILHRSNIDSLLDIKESTLKSITTILKETLELKEDSKEMLNDLISIIIEYAKVDLLSKK